MRGRRIFISYRRADAPGHAGRLYDSLRRSLPESDDVFMDVVALRPGLDFRTAVADFLATCDIFLAVIGPSWEHSDRRRGSEDYVMTEIETALRSSVYLIPVLVGGARMPSKLPASVRDLAHKHAVEMSDLRWSYDLAQLLDVIRSHEAADPGPTPPLPAAPPPAPRQPTARQPAPQPPAPPPPPPPGRDHGVAHALASCTGDSFTLVLPSGAERQADLHARLLDWFRSQGLETGGWVAPGRTCASGRRVGSAWSRWSGLDTGLIASSTQDGDALEVKVFAPPSAVKLTRVGIALVFLVCFPLMALPLYGGYRQTILLKECRAFLGRCAASPPPTAQRLPPLRRDAGTSVADEQSTG